MASCVAFTEILPMRATTQDGKELAVKEWEPFRIEVNQYQFAHAVGSFVCDQFPGFMQLLDATIEIEVPEDGRFIRATVIVRQISKAANGIKIWCESAGDISVFLHSFWRDGENAGVNGRSRDWKMPAEWHRGYLRGRLQRYRETGRMWI